MTPPRGHHIHANGIRQHYLHYPGAGPALVLVPGIVSPAMLWDHVGRWLGEHYNCFIVDVRGRGLSESGPLLDYGLDNCAADTLALVRALGLSRPIMVGHSMGARILLRAHRQAPALLGQLVLLDPPTSGPGRRPYPVPMARTLALVQAAQRGEAEPLLRQPGPSPWPEHLLLLRAQWLATCDTRAIEAAYADFEGQDLFADLALVRMPLALICAGLGDVVSDADLQEMLRLQPRMHTLRIPETGHQMQAENFVGFCQVLGQALEHVQTPSKENTP
ncbi:MAG: hypothetical protein RL559_1461 [Pseudomonadota bacterium]|jgi:N-formylmaleamate deformylase